MEIYNAVTTDVKAIYNLIQLYAKQGIVLPRSYLSLYQHLQCLFVAKENNEVIGVAGLHILGEDLGEVRSLVVSPQHSGKGIGSMLVNTIVNEASRLEVRRLMSFTYETTFFQKCGFEIVSKDILPEKVWIDCVNCPKVDSCDEIAMIKYIS